MAKKEEFIVLDDGRNEMQDIEEQVILEMYGAEEGAKILAEIRKEPIDITEDMPTDEELDAELDAIIDDELKAMEEEPELTDEEVAEKYGIVAE